MSDTVATRFGLTLPEEDTARSLGAAIEATPLATRPDEILINLIETGNTDALGLLFRRYARVVRRVALRVLKDPSEADDLLQDVFILIHRLCGTFDSSKTSAQLRLWPSILDKRKSLPPVGTGTMIDRSSSWSSASITFALGAKYWTDG